MSGESIIIVLFFVVALDDVIVIKLCVFCMIQDENDIIVDLVIVLFIVSSVT